jgi:hypothetical protein
VSAYAARGAMMAVAKAKARIDFFIVSVSIRSEKQTDLKIRDPIGVLMGK